MGPSPLLEMFKRGDAAADVRLLAAQGGLAVGAHEQLGILVHLLGDEDPEVRSAAEQTVTRIPQVPLSAFLARSDVATSLREHFAGRGIVPAQVAAEDDTQPLVGLEHDHEDGAAPADEDEEEDRESVSQRVSKMTTPQKLKAATKGTKEMRAILVRDPNKLISAAVMSSPKLTPQEVEVISRMASVSEDVLRMIGSNRSWMKNYKIASGLTKNPKTPLALSLHLLHRINDKDLTTLAVDRNVPEQLRVAAKKRILASRT